MIQILLVKKLAFFVVLVSISSAIASQTDYAPDLQAIAEDLPYQAHSFNDLDYARNLMLKKTKYFKFDASLANKQSCLKYSTWKSTSSCFNSSQYSQEICCIAMRGDAGSEPNFKFYFNTSDQFVSLLQSHLQKYGSKIDILFVAIDIQFNFQFKNTIAENFVYKLAGLMNNYKNLHIAVGSDLILEYDRICRYFTPKNNQVVINLENFIGQQACTQKRKQISQGRFFLQSGSMDPYDSRDYKGRFKNFNIIYKQIDRLCRDGFPIWPNKQPDFPLIFWEPSNQDQILSSLNKLLSPACQKKHNRTLKGIAFASNIDPQIFSVFMKPLNKTKSEWYYQNDKLLLEDAVSVKMTKITGVQDQSKTNLQARLVIFWQIKSENTIRNYLNIFSYDGQAHKIQFLKGIELNQQILELRGVQNKIIAIVKRNSSDVKEFNTFFLTYNSNLELIKSKQVDNFISSFAAQDCVYFITRTSNPTYFNLYSIDPNDLSPQPYGVSFYMPLQQINSITSIYFKKGQKKDEDIFLVFSNNKDKTWMSQMKNANIYKNKVLTYGTNSRLFLKQDGSLLILLQNSYMNSGLLLNNNAENKCLLHKSQSLSSLAHVLNLVNVLQGSIDSFMSFFNTDNEEIITACHPYISFSRYMNGNLSQIISIGDNIFVSTQYVPINKQDLIVTLFSGGSNYEKQLRNKTAFIIASKNGRNKLAKINQAIISEK